MKPKLYIFSGLPAAGKSTMAKLLAKKTQSFYLRIDTVEQALRDLCSFDVQGEGYRLSYRVAHDNLKLGINVVADCCNPCKLTRNEWESIAEKSNADYINIEVICSNHIEHKKRAETRISQIENMKLPDWESIINRDYQPWHKDVIILDTASKTVKQSFVELLGKLGGTCLG